MVPVNVVPVALRARLDVYPVYSTLIVTEYSDLYLDSSYPDYT